MRKKMKFNNNLQEVRRNNNLSQEELADKVNVSIKTIQSIEKGRYKPSISLSFTIASLLNKEIADIFPYIEA